MSASSTKTQIHELELYEWKDFLENSRKFMLQIIASNKQTYKRVNFDSSFTVHSHDDINTEIMFICRNIFKALHPGTFSFIHAPNGQPTKGDIYVYLTKCKKSHFLLVTKTPVDLPVDFSTLLNAFESNSQKEVAAINQVFNNLKNSQLSYGLLTRYDKTWCFYRSGNAMMVSECIETNELVLAIYFILSLSFPEAISLEESDKQFLQKIKDEDSSNLKSQIKANPKSKHNFIEESNPSKRFRSNEDSNNCSQRSSSSLGEHFSKSLVLEILEAIPTSQFLGEGACGCVVKITLNNTQYALKLCDVFKTEKSMIAELHNEAVVLKKLENKVNCVPTLRFSGLLSIHESILMTYIDGFVYEEFSEMNSVQKEACVNSLKELHQANCLHGDIQALDFIINKENKAYIIDFGSSSVLDATDVSQKRLSGEMNELLKKIRMN